MGPLQSNPPVPPPVGPERNSLSDLRCFDYFPDALSILQLRVPEPVDNTLAVTT